MIFVNDVDLSGNEKKYLTECIETGWISSDGPFVKRFEDEFSTFIGKKYGISVTNGTSALEVALYAAGIEEGDEVILPSFTIISCALAIIRLGAVPVLVDAEPEAWNMDVSLIEEKITEKTKAIMPVHIYGHPVDMDPIMNLAEKYGLKVIEDSAEVHGAEYKGKKCGSIGDLSCFSFYANKLITTGEGGMVLTDDEELFSRAASYRNLCFIREERFRHDEIGYNFRMTNMQAAVGVAQLERVEEIVDKKRAMGEYYAERLKKIPGVKTQVEKSWAKTVYWMYSLQLDKDLKVNARTVIDKLRENGIDSRPFFRGLHTQPALLKRGYTFEGEFPVTEQAYRHGLYLPSGLGLDFEKIDTICDIFESTLKSCHE